MNYPTLLRMPGKRSRFPLERILLVLPTHYLVVEMPRAFSPCAMSRVRGSISGAGL